MTWGTKRLEELVSGDVVAPPVVQSLKLGLVDAWKPGWVQKRWEPSAEIMNGDGSMFGGYLAALADQVLTFAAMSVVPDDKAFRTTNLNLQFLKVSGAQPLVIVGRVLAQTRQVISVEADFSWDDGTPIAKASAQQITTPFPDGRR